MSKDKGKSLGDHVKFTKHDHRPYVDPIDLVRSDNFRKIVREAAEKRRQALEGNERIDEQH